MNLLSRMLPAASLIVGLLASAALAANEDVTIDIQVAMRPGVPITAPQVWARRLGKLGLDRVQIRSMRGDEKPSAEINEEKNRVKVVAILSPRDELFLPDHRFRAHDLRALQKYFEELPHTLIEAGIERGLFGLTKEDFNLVLLQLEQPLGMKTAGRTAAEVLAHCEARLRLKFEQHDVARANLRIRKPLAAELEKLSMGTALAIALREAEVTIRPAEVAGSRPKFVVEPYLRDANVWPTGWDAEASPRQLAPKLFEQLNIEIAGFTLGKTIEALEPRMAVPVVYDYWTLERLKIEPAKIPVKLPKRKTYLKGAVDRLLSQARLLGEIRIDERGKAFLWITQYGPDSRPARE